MIDEVSVKITHFLTDKSSSSTEPITRISSPSGEVHTGIGVPKSVPRDRPIMYIFKPVGSAFLTVKEPSVCLWALAVFPSNLLL